MAYNIFNIRSLKIKKYEKNIQFRFYLRTCLSFKLTFIQFNVLRNKTMYKNHKENSFLFLMYKEYTEFVTWTRKWFDRSSRLPLEIMQSLASKPSLNCPTPTAVVIDFAMSSDKTVEELKSALTILSLYCIIH